MHVSGLITYCKGLSNMDFRQKRNFLCATRSAEIGICLGMAGLVNKGRKLNEP